MIFLIFIPLPSFGGIGAIFSLLFSTGGAFDAITEADRQRRHAEAQAALAAREAGK